MMNTTNTVRALSVALAFLVGDNTVNAAEPNHQLTPASEVDAQR